MTITTPEKMREAAANIADDVAYGRLHIDDAADAIRAIHIAPQPVAVTQEDWDAAARAIGTDVYDLKAALTIQPADPLSDPRVVALVEAVKRLSAACDTMWNDCERLEENPHRFGQEYQIKDEHVRAISEAQQCLPAALRAIGGGA